MRQTFGAVVWLAAVMLCGCPPGACEVGSVSTCTCSNGNTGRAACLADESGYGTCTNCGTTPAPACTPGTNRACACPGGTSGVQTCNASGNAYGSCGECTPVGPGPCSPSNPSGTCASGGTCLNGACCDAAQACGSVCCNAGATCIADAAGNRSCATRCTTNSGCPSASPCCAVVSDNATREIIQEYGVCSPFIAGTTYCRCSPPGECSGGGCTPYVAADGIPRRPMICTADGCGPYQRCTGFGVCPNGYCNMCDTAGNCYCAQVCTSGAMCGGATCGRLARSNGSCAATQTVCTP